MILLNIYRKSMIQKKVIVNHYDQIDEEMKKADICGRAYKKICFE